MTYALSLLILVAVAPSLSFRRAGSEATGVGHKRRSWLFNAAIWSSLLFLVSLGALFFLDALPAPKMAPRGRQLLQKQRAEAQLAEQDDRARSESGSDDEETARELFDRTFPSGWRASGSLQQIRHEEVMRVRPPVGRNPAEFRAQAPYYLRGLVLAEFDESGSQARIPASLPLFVDEDGDGWVELLPSNGHGEIELVVEQVPLIVRRGAWNVLFAPRPLHAIRAERVLFAEDALLALPATEEETRSSYVTRASDLRFDRDCPANQNSGETPGKEWIALPEGGATLDLLTSKAEEWTRGAGSDAERVRRIVGRFQSEFAYAAVSADVPGLEGIRNFLELERGYCTYFAAGTTLLLRTLGIPSRVATGFLAEQWDEEAGAFVVTTENGHAWVEVWFEGIGWLRVDPTPGRRRLRALGRVGDGPTGLKEWASTFGNDLRFVLVSGARSSDLGALRDTLLSLPSAFGRSVEARPWLFGLGLAGIALAFSRRLLQRRRSPIGARPMTRSERSVYDLEQSFRSALQERGAPNRPSRTLREQSRSVGEGEDLAEELARLRFGAEPPSAQELDGLRQRVEAF